MAKYIVERSGGPILDGPYFTAERATAMLALYETVTPFQYKLVERAEWYINDWPVQDHAKRAKEGQR